MRTTIRLDDQLLSQAKKLAAETGRTLTAVIEESLRESLARRRAGVRQHKVELKTFKGGSLQPGVDLDDSAALLELISRTDAAP